MKIQALLLALPLLLMVGCAPSLGAASVTGTVTYLQRISLPPDAVVTVRIEDVSLADAPSEVIGEQVIETEGKQVPIPFEVTYKPSDVEDNHRYSVRARIEDGSGKLLFTSDTVMPVITGGNPTSDVEIVVVPVTSGTAPVQLDGSSWVLVTLNGQPALAETVITLNFESGKISGSDGCNRYSASYTVDGGTLTVAEDMVSTEMACSEPIMEQAGAFTTALQEAGAYGTDGEQLELLDPSGTAWATFTAASSELDGTSWIVISYNNGKQGVVTVLAGTELTASWADGQVSGSAGCNNYTATYEVSEQEIRLGQAAVTQKLCAAPAGVMEQETLYLQALATAATYRIEGNQLELRTADDALAVKLTKAP